MALRAWPSTLILFGVGLGLAAMFLNWTGDGRGIDYIRPGERFEYGYRLPVPLTILAIGAVVGMGLALLGSATDLANVSWSRGRFRLLGALGGLMVATFPLLAHFGYEFWIYWNEGGGRVFRSGDWGVGLSLALAGGSIAVAGVVVSRLIERRR